MDEDALGLRVPLLLGQRDTENSGGAKSQARFLGASLFLFGTFALMYLLSCVALLAPPSPLRGPNHSAVTRRCARPAV